MAINTTLVNVGADAMAAAAKYLSIHTDVPDASGSNESAAARVSAGWGSASGGAITATNKAFTGGAASGAAKHVGFWSASTGGTFYGYQPLTGDQSFNAAGQYTLTSVSLNGAAS